MNRVHNMLGKIRENPEKYLDSRTIFCLNDFVSAYSFGISSISGYGDVYALGIDRNFQQFIEKKYNFSDTIHWSIIVNFYSANELEAFDNSFVHFNEFEANEKSVSVSETQKIRDFGAEGPRCRTLNLLLGMMREKQGVWFGTKSLISLYGFVTGYNAAQKELTDKDDMDFFHRF